jgi:ATP-dependent helicase Lhr and Lhr-like helicase
MLMFVSNYVYFCPMAKDVGKRKARVNGTEVLHACSSWMERRSWQPAAFQEEAWEAWLNQRNGLVNAPTGSGKTYALLLPFLLDPNDRPKGIQLIWITPIRALAKEIYQSAMRVIEEENLACRVAIKTGDTEQKAKDLLFKEPPHLLITTPESLHLMLARKGSSLFFKHLRTVVVDEWHELMSSKRGVMMELAMARLRTWSPGLMTWGISATIGNMEQAMEVLLGPHQHQQGIWIKSSIQKQVEVQAIIPATLEKLPWAGHLGIRLLEDILPLIHQSVSTLVFTNTRGQCEIWYKKLLDADPSLAGVIAMHHGSVSKEIRHWVEDALYEGRLKVVVCTGSLDLGVDFSPVETIIQIGSPKGIARFLQRAGRSGHRPGEVSRIYFLPTHALELVEASALRYAAEHHIVEARVHPQLCFDVLCQYLVTLALGEGFEENAMLEEVRQTYGYQDLLDEEWKWILAFITRGGASLGQYPDFHKVTLQDGLWRVTNTRIARRHRLSIGTIVSETMIQVKQQRGGFVGHVEETFITSMKENDIFWLAGQSWQLIRVKELTATVKKIKSDKGRVPAWLGGRLPLSSSMSELLRFKLALGNQEFLENDQLRFEPELAYLQPMLKLQRERSHLPNNHELLIENFETEDGHHVMIYPFEGRFVHQGLANLFAYRIGQSMPISFSLAYNDYGLELLSDQPIPIEEMLGQGLTDALQLERDLLAGINASDLARRKFKEIASIAGLVFKGYPGAPIRERHLITSAGLIFDVLSDYDPHNLLLRQAYDEVLHFELEIPRMRAALDRINQYNIVVRRPEKPTPFAFPIMVDRLRERMSSESMAARIAKMTIAWEG